MSDVPPLLPEIWRIICLSLPLYARLRLSQCSKHFLSLVRPTMRLVVPEKTTKLISMDRIAHFYDLSIYPSPDIKLPTRITSIRYLADYLSIELNANPFPLLRSLYFFGRATLQSSLHNLECITGDECLIEFGPFTKLTRLSCFPLGQKDFGWPSLSPSLRCLLLGSHTLPHLSLLSHLTNLEKLGGALGSITEEFLCLLERGFTRLRSLQLTDVAGAWGSSAPFEVPLTPSPLRLRRFSAPYLTRYIAKMIHRFTSLRSLHLENHRSGDVDLSRLPHLEKADIGRVPLEYLSAKRGETDCLNLTKLVGEFSLSPEVFQFKSLKYLGCLDRDYSFAVLDKLEHLRLQWDKTWHIPVDALSELSSLSSLRELTFKFTADERVFAKVVKALPSLVPALLSVRNLEVFHWDTGSFFKASFVRGDLEKLKQKRLFEDLEVPEDKKAKK